jgi:hypothetical protein
MATIFPQSASVGQISGFYTFNGDHWVLNGLRLTGNYITEENLQDTLDTSNLEIDGGSA